MHSRLYVITLFASLIAVGDAGAQYARVTCEPRSTVMTQQLVARGARAEFDLTALASRPALAYASAGGWEALRADEHSRRFRLAIDVDARSVERLASGAGGLRAVELRFGRHDGTLSRLTLRAPSGKTVTLFEGQIRRPSDGRAVSITPLTTDNLARSGWYVPAPGARPNWEALAGETVEGTWQLTGFARGDVREPLQLAGATLHFEDRRRDRIVAPPGVIATGANRFGVSPEGSGTYRFSVFDSAGCAREFAYPVQVESDCDFRVRRVASRPPTCPGAADGKLAFVVSGAAPGVTYALDGRVSSSGAFTGLAAGDYLLTVRGAGGCIVEQAVTLADPERGFVSAEWVATSCAPAEYEAKLVPVSLLTVATARWEDTGGDGFVERTALGPGEYAFGYEDVNGCAYADTLRLPEAGEVTAAVSLEEPPCAGEGAGAVRLEPSGGVAPYAALWDDLGAGMARDFAFAGEYGGTVYDARGCEVAFAATLDEPSRLLVRPELLPPTCPGDRNGVLVVAASGGRAPYELRVDSGPWSGDLRSDTLDVGAHSYTLRDAAGCEVTEVVYVAPRSHLPAEFEPRVFAKRKPVVAGDTLRLDVGPLAEGTYSSQWTYSRTAWIACDTCDATAIAPAAPGTGTVLVSVSDSLGCTAEASVELEVAHELSVPAVFGPGTTDANVRILRVRGRSGTVIDRFAVYDSNGTLVFEDVDFEVGTPRGWDGTLSGTPAPAGDYAYKVEARAPSGERSEVEGTTTLVR